MPSYSLIPAHEHPSKIGHYIAPPTASIPLGNYYVDERFANANRWQNSFALCYFLYYTRVLPTVDAVRTQLHRQGISTTGIHLRDSSNPSVCFYDPQDRAPFFKQTVVDKAAPNTKRFNKKKVLSGITEYHEITKDMIFLYRRLKGAAVGKYVKTEIDVDPEQLGTIKMSFHLPVTQEALRKGAHVLNAMVRAGFLKKEDVLSLHQTAKEYQVVERVIRPGVTIPIWQKQALHEVLPNTEPSVSGAAKPNSNG